MIDSGRWSGAVRRPTDAGDFIDDGTGQRWDVKGFHSEWPDHLAATMGDRPFPQAVTRDQFEQVLQKAVAREDMNVLLDVRMVDATALGFMKDVVGRNGWRERVEWYP